MPNDNDYLDRNHMSDSAPVYALMILGVPALVLIALLWLVLI